MPPEPFRPSEPLVIGLVGGIAAGKTAVAELFADAGLRVIDADRLAREVTARPEITGQLARRFGSEILDGQGALHRKALAARVFADPQARADLEAITHPEIRKAILAELDAASAVGESVLLDVPLLLEGGLIERCQVTVFVQADDELRRDRARGRGWPPGEFERREAAQAPLPVKKARSAFTIDNSTSLQDTARQVAAILRQLSHAGGARS